MPQHRVVDSGEKDPDGTPVEIMGIGKLSLDDSNGEKYDACSEDGRSEAPETVESEDSSDSSTVRDDRTWTRRERGRGQRRCNESSSESSDSSPSDEDSDSDSDSDEHNREIRDAVNDKLKNCNLNTSERDINSNCAEHATSVRDIATSPEENQKSEDTESDDNSDSQYIQRGPVRSNSRTNPLHAGTPYGRHPRNDESDDLDDIDGIPTKNLLYYGDAPEEVQRTTDYILFKELSGTCMDTISIDPSQQNTSGSELETPSLYSSSLFPPCNSATSSGLSSPESTYRSLSPGSPWTRTSSPGVYLNNIRYSIDASCETSPISNHSWGTNWSINDNSTSPKLYTPSPIPIIVHAPSGSDYSWGANCAINDNSTSSGSYTASPVPTVVRTSSGTVTINTPAINNTNPSENMISTFGSFSNGPAASIPTPVSDINNTRNRVAVPGKPRSYERNLIYLDTPPSRHSDKFMEIVPLKYLKRSMIYHLGMLDEEFAQTDENGNTSAMIVVSREGNLKEKFADLLVHLERMVKLPRSFAIRDTLHGYDILYMVAIYYEKYPFITGLVLEKMFKAQGADREIWTRKYGDSGNTLIHIVVAKGSGHVDVLRELLDVETTGNRAVFDLSLTNNYGERPLDLTTDSTVIGLLTEYIMRDIQ